MTPIYLGKDNDKTLRQIVGTLPNKGNNNAIQKGKSTKTDKTDKKLNHLNQRNNCHIPDLVQAFSKENGGF